MMTRYPDRIPILIEPRTKCTPPIDRHKYMTPRDLSFGQLIYVVRKRLRIGREQGLYLFIGNTLVPSASPVLQLYDKYRDDDGFLYVVYSLENTFGERVAP